MRRVGRRRGVVEHGEHAVAGAQGREHDPRARVGRISPERALDVDCYGVLSCAPAVGEIIWERDLRREALESAVEGEAWVGRVVRFVSVRGDISGSCVWELEALHAIRCRESRAGTRNLPVLSRFVSVIGRGKNAEAAASEMLSLYMCVCA